MDGLLVIDKPQGITSHDVVRRVRRALKTRKVGHAGTLDPMATGLLLVAVGEGTRILQFLMEGDKTYRTTLKLGECTDTQDAEGTVLEQQPVSDVTIEMVEKACRGFVGEISQVPPMYSALKKDGIPLYKFAREGIEVEREARRVRIDRLEVVEIRIPQVTLDIDCSKGTYIRTLGHDIGQALGCGAHLTALRRVRSGSFSVDQSISLEALEDGTFADHCPALLPLVQALGDLPALEVTPEACVRLRNGIPPSVGELSTEVVAGAGSNVLLLESGRLLAVARYAPDRGIDKRGDFQLLRVFNRG